MTEKRYSDMMKSIKILVPFCTIGDKMSFVISRKQFLAPSEEKTQYEPIVFDEEGFEVKRIDVSFGHPLYSIVADILYIKTNLNKSQVVPVIPDGCMALVFESNGEDTEIYFCGVIDEIKKLIVKPDYYYVFMRFLPGIGYEIVDQPASLLTNKSMSIRGMVPWGEQVAGILERDMELTERIRLISKIVRINVRSESNKYLVKYCTERIFQTQGNVRIESLSEETGFTSRHIGKTFEKCIGISPKLFSQIIRLQISMNRILEDRNALLVDIAIDSGFFDHAHMNRMYKKLIRCSSGEFRKNFFNRLDYSLIEEYISK